MSEQNAVRNELSLAQENAALRSRVAVLEEELALIREQLAWLKKQVFGRKTEQSSVIMDNGQQSDTLTGFIMRKTAGKSDRR